MHRRFALLAALLLGVILISTYNRADAVITAKTPLDAIEGSAKYIVVGKVEKYFPDKPAMLVTITEDIKGKAPFRALPINCKVADAKTFKANEIEPLLKRFGPDIEIIFFIDAPAPGSGRKNLRTFAFTNGTWFLIIGTPTGEKDNVVFSLTSAEPYFRKSFQGTNDELRKLLKDHAAGKGKLPPLDDKVQPGFGPEYTPQKKVQLRLEPDAPARERWNPSLALQAQISGGGQLFGVIPTLAIGAPLAILAMLFPTVFGGALVNMSFLFRQFLAFLTLTTVIGLLLMVHGLILWLAPPEMLRGAWWTDYPALWFVMTMTTFACTLWAWRRQLNLLYAGASEVSAKVELVVLTIMTVGCVLTTVVMWFMTTPVRWSDAGWIFTIVMTLGIIAGTLNRSVHAVLRRAPFASAPLATEGIILGVMLLGCLAFTPALGSAGIDTAGAVESGEPGKSNTPKVAVSKPWPFVVDVKGMYASSPLVDGDYVYGAYSETVTRVATVVKLERKTGLKKWEFFGKNEDLIQMISTPCLADGKLFFGEGFHDDKNCKVYCVDAETGKEEWRFATAGQTESSPAVANGKVYIGAGNDGVYCLDARTGNELWKFPSKEYKGRLMRFGGGMTVVGARLYCGTGVDRNEPNDKGETAAFCLDAATGKFIWKAAMPYPVWSTPVVRDGVVYVTTGNGDVFEDAKAPETPGGALMSLEADTGKEQWRVAVPNGIIESPAVDAYRVYFGCRDKNLYCVNRADGKERWKAQLDSPVIGTPVLDTDAVGERTLSVFATASAGKVCCVAPLTGDIVWTYNLTAQKAYIATSPRLVVTPTRDGTRRQLYFGCGLGGGTLDISANRPVFYCLEDVH